MFKTLVFCAMLLGSALAQAGAEQFLPAEMKGFVFKKTTPSQVAKALGKPKEIDKSKRETIYYYNRNGVDYDTVLSFRNNKLFYILLSNLKTPLSFNELKTIFTEEDLKKAIEEANIGTAHETGRAINLVSKKEGLKVRLTNSERREVQEITFWQKGLNDL